ncbi:hypothetical protein [Cryptosporangium aurantiacum]|uniref:FXSXX-COOH protein n=1 Tax=Cryptosporangium aurantiacum TaxID=134849 RepID=A0A1M7R1H6_9ACTN|nr:hypothetical protein [Cryptosporangium aurantiacum]SHN38656.1 FXSXX-COOH protein [Cryptosporangium aurantiacum]
MNETGDEAEDARASSSVILDVTQLPLLGLVGSGDSVLGASIRSVVDDVVNQRELTAGFGNIP